MTGKEITGIDRGVEALIDRLRKAWPGVDWAIVAEEWPGGSEIRIFWTGGPLEAEVRPVVEPFEYPHFDGPMDLYQTMETPQGGAKFVTLYREA